MLVNLPVYIITYRLCFMIFFRQGKVVGGTHFTDPVTVFRAFISKEL